MEKENDTAADAEEPYFKFRLNNIDNFVSPPSDLDYPIILSKPIPPGKKVEASLPILRVFGSTETGQKICAYIHGVFPYMYVEYTGSLIPDDGS